MYMGFLVVFTKLPGFFNPDYCVFTDKWYTEDFFSLIYVSFPDFYMPYLCYG